MPPANRLEPQPWREPLELVADLPAPFCLLYDPQGTSRLACLPQRICESWSNFQQAYREGNERWFGYFGYEMLQQSIGDTFPPVWMFTAGCQVEWHHAARQMQVVGELPQMASYPVEPPQAQGLWSSYSREEYLVKVDHILSAIRQGDYYQANLTRKFFTRLQGGNARPLFARLCQQNPARYAALMMLDEERAVLSASPEMFLRFTKGGKVEAEPIKGTRKRQGDDGAERSALAASEKDRAENLMIVDLMRHDLAQYAVPGSVEVEALYAVTTHPTLHHLSSRIAAQRHPQSDALDILQACFPPGSMTGAPKIAAMTAGVQSVGRDATRGVFTAAQLGWLSREDGTRRLVRGYSHSRHCFIMIVPNFR